MKLEITLPETCAKCGARLSMPHAHNVGKYTIIERLCVGPKIHIDRVRIQTTFTDADRAKIMYLST